MNKFEFLAASLPYNLVVKYTWNNSVRFFNGSIYDEILNDKLRYTPIIRPFSDLYKECIQANYNDGKPFVPIVELAKIAYDEEYWTLSSDFDYAISPKKEIFYLFNNWGFLYSHHYAGQERPPKQFELYQQLIKWHFWPYMKEDENVVYITDDFNPYK